MELLLVVAILGISLAVVAPRLGGLIEGGQAAVASRVVAQAGRYARSMALLNQIPVELVLILDRPEVGVEVAKVGQSTTATGWMAEADGLGSSAGFGPARSRDDRTATARTKGFRSAPDPGREDGTIPPDPEGGGIAEEIELRRALEGVRLEFGGFQDRSGLLDSDPITQGTVRLRYHANGVCRPYRVAIIGVRTEERFILEVDSVGTPFLLRPGDSSSRRGP